MKIVVFIIRIVFSANIELFFYLFISYQKVLHILDWLFLFLLFLVLYKKKLSEKFLKELLRHPPPFEGSPRAGTAEYVLRGGC